MLRTGSPQQRGLVGAAHDVDEADAVLAAQAAQHLAEVRRRGRVHQRGVAFQPHGADQPQRGPRIDEAEAGDDVALQTKIGEYRLELSRRAKYLPFSEVLAASPWPLCVLGQA